MNRQRLLALLLLLPLGAWAQVDQPPPWPRWSDEDTQRLLEGEELLSDLLFRPLEESDVTASVMAGVPLPSRGIEEESNSPELSEEVLAKYVSQKPKNFLIDPQKFLSRQEYRDRLSFLKYHASDSSVGLYVYLLDDSQQWPPDTKLENLWRNHFADAGPTVLVCYFMGNPSRSEIFVSPNLMESVGKAEQTRALQSSVKNAYVKSDPVDQLDGFCEQLSTRIYWMEKAFKAGVIAPPDEEAQDSAKSASYPWLVPIRQWWKKWQWSMGMALAATTCVVLLLWWRRAHRRYQLPVFDVPHRLGGNHAASVGAVISYSNPYLSAQAQREKPPGEWDLL
jgi:hypothetical protein